MSRTSLLTAVCALVVLSSGTATAQSIAPATPRPSAPLRFDYSQVGAAQLGSAPTAESNVVATRDALASANLSSRRTRTPGVVLMIVGGASVVTGLLISENVFTILGAAAFLIGLYQYLRAT
jgi:type V secretory pathway adhesin AidA